MDAEARPTTAPVWLRTALIGLGITLLLWLPFEDTDIRIPNLVSLAGNALLGVYLSHRWIYPSHKNLLHRYLGLGLLVGLGIGPLAAFLMVFKSGLHAHGYPDYSTAQFVQVLTLTPLWVALGGLLGLATGLWRRSG